MNEVDFEYIESTLEVVLPNEYKEFMCRFPNDRRHQLANDCDFLPCNAELFVIAQCRRFSDDAEFNYYELQPELRNRRFLDIGGDGCGNFYCMVGDKLNSNELWLWAHDPYDGLVRCEDTTLKQYFGQTWELKEQADPFAAYTPNGRTITRANHPLRGILNPISIAEWLDYVRGDPQLALDEFHNMTNPFTKEIVRVCRWPGRAKLTIGNALAHVTYLYGCITLSDVVAPSPDIEAKLQQLASSLDAHRY